MIHNDLDQFYALIEHRRPRRILFYAHLAEDMKKRVVAKLGVEDISAHFGMFVPVDVTPGRPKNLTALNYSEYYKNDELPEGTVINAFGVARIPGNFFHYDRFLSPLRKASCISQIKNYPLDDVSKWDFSYMAKIVAEAHVQGKVVSCYIGDIYEIAWQIRGYEPFLMDMLSEPTWAELLLDRIAERNRIISLACARAGVDLIQCGDDVASQIGLMFNHNLWRQMIHSRWSKIWSAVKNINPKAKIWYHSDGNIRDIIGELIDAGVDILNPVQPECMDTDRIYNKYRNKLTFDGTIGTQTTMPFGTPDQITSRVKEVIDKYGQRGGLIVSPTHVLGPDVPIENFLIFCKACQEYSNLER